MARKAITEEDARSWNKCVYEPNRNRVEAFRKRYGYPAEMPPEDDKGECGHCVNGVCALRSCPAFRDACPIAEHTSFCKYGCHSALY